jgi:hypothetical protein
MEQPAAAESRAPVIRGGFLAESLRPGTGFEDGGMRITRCSRFQVGSAADYQPAVWTLIEFEAPAENADALAGEFAGRLLSPGWYVNWNSDTEATVVFPGRVFRYPRGDAAGRREAAEHGRRCGVPEPQLDWAD